MRQTAERAIFGERTNVEIKIAILELAVKPVTRLEIVHKIYLSDRIAKAVIDQLLSEAMLQKSPAVSVTTSPAN